MTSNMIENILNIISYVVIGLVVYPILFLENIINHIKIKYYKLMKIEYVKRHTKSGFYIARKYK